MHKLVLNFVEISWKALLRMSINYLLGLLDFKHKRLAKQLGMLTSRFQNKEYKHANSHHIQMIAGDLLRVQGGGFFGSPRVTCYPFPLGDLLGDIISRLQKAI